MHLVDIVPPTLAVVASWLWLGAVVAGVGHATRRALLFAAGSRVSDHLRPADLWLGLAALVAYLQVWNLVAPITWKAWPAPVLVAAVGLALGGRALRHISRPAVALPVVVAVAVGGLWIANRALAGAFYYDAGLYHFGIIEYASHFAAVPGLGNLHGRLGADDGHLLLVAFVDRGPFTSFGYHVTNALLGAMLIADLSGRFVRRPVAAPLASYTGRMALLLVPATLVAVVGGKGSRINNPDLDFAVFVLVVIGTLYLVECLEFGFRATPALVSGSSLSLASTTRPLYWPLALLGLGLLAFTALRRPRRAIPSARVGTAVLALPAALLLGWMGRQIVLTGYPLFPLAVGGLPVDWRMSASAVHALNRYVASWARSPGDDPTVVLASWHWFHPWLRHHVGDVDVLGPILLLVGAAPALAARSSRRAQRRRAALVPMLAVALPAAVLIVVWFFTAPDPRFALAPLWLLPISIVAWVLPLPGDGLAHVRVTYAGFVVVLLVMIGLVAAKGVLRPIVSNQGGPLGTEPVPGAAVAPFVTESGLRIYRPTQSELCWRVLLCTPQPNPRLKLRGARVADGFKLAR